MNLDKIAGVILGTAIGDALGAPVEFMDMAAIRLQYGRVEKYVSKTVLDGREQALYTDDTQMMRAVCEGLMRARTQKEMDWAAEEVAAEFVAWAFGPDNTRSPGGACMLGCKNLKDGMPWREAGKLNGGGCGTAMRSMAYGLWFDDPVKAGHWAGEHALMTHRLPMAQASAAAVATIVSALRTIPNPKYITGMEQAMRSVAAGISAAKRYDTETAAMIGHAYKQALGVSPLPHPFRSRVVDPRERDTDDRESAMTADVLDEWRGWAGHEAVAASVYCFMVSPGDFAGAVLRAVNSPGDSDSLGAITGAFAGAHVGLRAIPIQWITGIEKTSELQVLASRMLSAKNSCE